MSENQTQGGTSLLNIGAETGVKKLTENFTGRALNALVNCVKNKYGEAQVLLGGAFGRYLQNATRRYNQVRTLATGPSPRNIIGKDGIYVSIGVQHEKKEIDTATVDPMLCISKNILISGTGGVGKSMLMRYLFLNTADRGEYVPVLLELRRVSHQSAGHISILDLIYSCMEDFDVQLPKEQFEYSLRLGRYLFLLDGFDEVKENLAAETAEVIQKFCAKYPKNPCIITSRPRRNTSPLETFTVVDSMNLSKDQAVLLASKIWKEDEKTKEFCRQLNEELYEKHQDFAENPLLLSMMFLTFMRNNSVPDHLVDFYSKAYDALYSAHDSHDKGYYRREFKYETLDESCFRRLLSRFCFQTYFDETYEFSKDEILRYLKDSIRKLGLEEAGAASYLEDLRNIVCILIKDGDTYRFSHRSFQAYFAACYTSEILTDEEQKKLFATTLSKEIFWEKGDYYDLLAQIEPQRFAINALEKGLREVQKIVNKNSTPDICFLEIQYAGFAINIKSGKIIFLIEGGGTQKRYNFNIIEIFRRYIVRIKKDFEKLEERDLKFIKEHTGTRVYKRSDEFIIEFCDIDIASAETDEDWEYLYNIITRINKVKTILEEIARWLNELDEKRIRLGNTDFLHGL